MTLAIHVVSIDPWAPAIDVIYAEFPLLIGEVPEAVLEFPGRWACGQWCEITVEKGRPTARIYETQADRSPRTSLLQQFDLGETAEFQVGIRTLSVEILPKKPRTRRAPQPANVAN